MDALDADQKSLREEILRNQKLIDDLNASVSRKTQAVRVIQEVAAELNSTLDLNQVLDRILTSMDKALGFKHSMVLVADNAGDTLSVAASRGYEDSGVGAVVKVGVGPIGVVAKRKKIMRMGAMGMQRMYTSAVRAQIEKTGDSSNLAPQATLPGLPNVQSQIALPLVSRDRLIGVFAVESAKPNAFDEVDEQLLAILANHAATAVDNARLYQAEANRLKERDEANAQLAKLNENLESMVRARTAELENTHAEVTKALEAVKIQKQRADTLLTRMAPAQVIPLMLENKLQPRKLKATIVFTDLEGFTQFSSGMEPDELLSRLNNYFSRAGDTILRYRGYVNKTIGDAIMAIFGVPYGNATHPIDAILAALALQAEQRKFFPLNMRIGINTGTLTAGALGPSDKSLYDVLGDAVNVASRMEKECPPGGVTFSAETLPFVERYFKVKSLGVQQVKGKGAMECYQAQEVRPLLEDANRVKSNSRFSKECAGVIDDVGRFKNETLPMVDFLSVQSRDGAILHNETVAALSLAVFRGLTSGALRPEGTSDAGESFKRVSEKDLLLLAYLHDLGKHAIDPDRLNAQNLSSADREQLASELRDHTLAAVRRLGIDHLSDPVERLYRFERSGGTVHEENPLVLMVASADMYDALTSPKIYKGQPWRITGALEELLRIPHNQRHACPYFRGLAELMKPEGTTIADGRKADILFR